MQYLVNQITELIAERQPTSGGEAIILVNGFERLKIYAEIATTLNRVYSNSNYKINIKLARNKWNELSKDSDTVTVQLMKQKEWVADKDSVTYYRNLHNTDILVLLGTEGEEDTGGLANCFCLTPEKLLLMLDGNYHKVFEQCFITELTAEDKKTIDIVYKKLFEFVPADITKLSDFSDLWLKQFDTVNDFLEEFGKNLSVWGFPNLIDKPLTDKIVNKKK